jgi:hypothetical protein
MPAIAHNSCAGIYTLIAQSAEWPVSKTERRKNSLRATQLLTSRVLAIRGCCQGKVMRLPLDVNCDAASACDFRRLVFCA